MAGVLSCLYSCGWYPLLSIQLWLVSSPVYIVVAGILSCLYSCGWYPLMCSLSNYGFSVLSCPHKGQTSIQRTMVGVCSDAGRTVESLSLSISFSISLSIQIVYWGGSRAVYGSRVGMEIQVDEKQYYLYFEIKHFAK